ncbi:Hypothetical protein PHPALM_8589 [Phytophthora palmivora]|uniref:Uncharacterized protein n=1 Tax=Phytophthora palmivora TaxID=4796 RepID=A0A2P4Y9G3_9STRA|nr:Hypothetical protein PHPALM_8589 [Phytophthora palmivora]
MKGVPLSTYVQDNTVADEWRFMLPWCDHVRSYVGYCDGESSDAPGQSYYGLKIYSPRRASIIQSHQEADLDIKTKRFHLREALKLLSVVSLVDQDTWKKLLMHSGVVATVKIAVPEHLDGQFPARFLLELPYGKRTPADDYDSFMKGRFVQDTGPEDVLRGDLVFFCELEQHAKSSNKYNATLRKIISIWREKQQVGDIPDEIEIPLTIQANVYIGRNVVTYTQNVLKAVRHLREQRWPRNVNTKGLPRVTFVLESIGADLRPIPIRSDTTSLVENLARDGIICSGLSFRQELGNALAAPVKRGAARKSVGRLLTSLFGGVPNAEHTNAGKYMTGPRANSSNQLNLNSVHFHCEPFRSWFFERACSAAVINQTTSHVSVAMEMRDENAALYTWRWQWVCYGFFSERACRLSRLQRLTLQRICLSRGDVEAMRAVMLAECPEEILLGLSHQEQQHKRHDFSIKEKTSLRLQPMNTSEDLGSNSSFTVSKEIRGVKVLGNSAENGWIDVLVPGLGKCQTRRSSLVSNDTPVNTTGVSSLVLIFEEDPDDDVLCQFLGLIGSSLQSLTIQVSSFRTVMLERITVNCPRLREIAVCTPAVEVRFQVRDDRLQNPITVHPVVPSSFEDVTELVTFFCAKTFPLVRAVRRLRVHIRRNYDNGTMATSFEKFYGILLFLLQNNRTLEYLDVMSARNVISKICLLSKMSCQRNRSLAFSVLWHHKNGVANGLGALVVSLSWIGVPSD